MDPRGRQLERVVSAIVLATTVLLVARPFFLVEWYDNDEVDRYPGRLEVLFDHMRWDNPWPRWIPELAGGHGYPLFDFFNPMSLIVGLPFRALGLAPHDAMKIAIVVLFAIGAIHTRLLGDRLFGRWIGLLASVLYLTAPYTLSNFYVRGDLAEAGAMMVYPLILHHYLAYAETGRRRNWIAIAIGYAMLVPMHAFSAMMFTHAFAVIWTISLVRDWRRGIRSPLRHVEAGLAAALGILCASFYWIPVLAEMSTVSIEGFFTMETFDNFAIPVYGIWVRNVPGPLGERLLTLGPVLWCFFAIGLWPRVPRTITPRKAIVIALVGFVIFTSIMSTNASWPLYQILFWLQRIVFPWRWFSIGSLAIALIGARAAITLSRGSPSWRAPIAVGLACLALVLTWPDAVLRRPVELATDHWAFAERGEREHILFDYGEYYPATVRVRPGADARDFFTSGTCSVSGFEEGDRAIAFHVTAGARCRVTVTQFLWIPWHARIDGAPAPIETDAQGRMRLAIPEGEHDVRIVWVPTLPQVLGERLTVVGLVALAILVVLALVVPRRRTMYTPQAA